MGSSPIISKKKIFLELEVKKKKKNILTKEKES